MSASPEDDLRNSVHLFLLAAAWLLSSFASAEPFRAAISRLSVPGETSFDVLIAYPTAASETELVEGPFKFRASKDGPIAPDSVFPIVLFAKGNGSAAGSPLVHHDLILRLAREGFVVVAPYYPNTPRPFITRPRQTRSALEAAAADERLSGHVDPNRIGMTGYSFGGAVTLIMAGAKPNLALLSAYCREHGDDLKACEGVSTDGSWANIPSRRSDYVIPLKALVLLEPLGAPFGSDDLIALNMPILIYRALQSDLRADGNALSLVRNLPGSPRQASVPGGHGIFLAPCPPTLNVLCSDPPDVDRIAIHDRVGDEVVDFFRSNL
ncbi:alpha/beta hydrolase family protein [Bradyrhizobium iriomotense]|uniref:alpha/beta hydrolase family protein n=1 Tax=Bradyrhizobium iriomotense TaxID=441950 RepID=UPI001B8A5281|nr:alpha/beta hydrolase fold domain-containing protein [Bradyrhizobium iriomotense]MBR0781657.1 alpha/beta hydrolase fold domain-containing protein [Bradyrhizobium iriomotense]